MPFKTLIQKENNCSDVTLSIRNYNPDTKPSMNEINNEQNHLIHIHIKSTKMKIIST